MASVGTIVWLSSELMFFAGLFAIYFTLRSTRPDLWEAGTEHLNVPFAFANTAILVISSLWCQFGVAAAERGQGSRTGGLLQFGKWGMREWFVLTYIFGAIFVAGQIMEYAELYHHGLTLQASAYTSAFYLTTGFHGIHVIGGVIAWLVFNGFEASTMSAGSVGKLSFNLAVSPGLLWEGIKWALAIGLVGGLFPAVRAASLPVTTALREA